MDMNQAMRFGTAAGALAVTRQGSQDAMPNRKEVNSLLSVNSNDALL
jgi:sugar/nucleoside kinase (ribokinase family)